MTKSIRRTVSNSQLKTLGQFINFYQLIGENGKAMSVQEMLNFVDEFGNTNRKNIRLSYDLYKPLGESIPPVGSEEDRIFPATILSIPIYAYQRDFIRVETNAVKEFDVALGNAKSPLNLWADDFSSIVNYTYGGNLENKYKKNVTKPRVWIWCRALGKYPNGALIDVSMFVKSISTSISENGGNFSLMLSAIACEWREGKIYPIYTEYNYGNGKNFYSKSSTVLSTKEGLKRNQFYFHQVLQSNDVVFLSFDNSESENSKTDGSIEININEIAYYTELLNFDSGTTTNNLVLNDAMGISYQVTKNQRRFDMIGLIDTNSQSFTSSPPSVNISITGRDLFKLFIDDQEKFFPLEYTGRDIRGIFNNLNNDNIRLSRAQRRLDGELASINAFVDNTIQECLVFIFAMLSHVEIAPESLFSSWGNLRTVYKYPNEPKTVKEGEIINGVKVSKDFKQITGFTETIGAGIWGIVKVIVDDDDSENSLKIRRVVDSSIRTEQGSIINYMRRVCQSPFVQTWGDTIGNQYYYFVRRPPFYEKAMKKMIDIYNDLDTNSLKTFHIREKNVISDNLKFDDSEVYSWYKINPVGNYVGEASTLSNAYLPAVFFPEFAERWGARAMEVTSNFIDYTGVLRGANQSPSLNYLERQAVNDLRFLVQIHSYLPFTRKGDVTIDLDFRYKKGMFVRYISTDEVYYIEEVQHNYSVGQNGVNQSTTKLTLSHGMVDKQQQGVRTLDLYFRLIDYFENLNRTPENYVLVNWSVNRTVWEYLVRGLQFSDELDEDMLGKIQSIVFSVKTDINQNTNGTNFNPTA